MVRLGNIRESNQFVQTSFHLNNMIKLGQGKYYALQSKGAISYTLTTLYDFPPTTMCMMKYFAVRVIKSRDYKFRLCEWHTGM